MFNISPLTWTDLNPTATPFVPKNKDSIELCNSSLGDPKCSKSSTSLADPKSSTSKPLIPQKVNEKSKTNNKKWKPLNKKPSNVTLEQFIIEKLKIEDQVMPQKEPIISKKKTETHPIVVNSLDSSAPTRRRGKEREIPKPKKPTTLKKIIIQEKNGQNVKTIESVDDNNDKEDENEDKNKSDEYNYMNKCNFDDLDAINAKLLHNNSYREYCCQILTQEIDNFVVNLLSDLVLFQDRMHSRDPQKAKMKKRLCFGFREVTKYAIINKVKMLVIAPDIEKIESKGGLDDTLTNLIQIVSTNGIPIVFALNRKKLGITSKKKGFISCVGVLNYDGSQDNYKQLISLCESARVGYNLIFEESKDKLKTLSPQQIEEILLNLPHIPTQFSDFSRRLNTNRRFIRRKEFKT